MHGHTNINQSLPDKCSKEYNYNTAFNEALNAPAITNTNEFHNHNLRDHKQI